MNTPTSHEWLHFDPSTPAGNLLIAGEWTLPYYAQLQQQLATRQLPLPATQAVDLSQLNALDTAGATLLVKLLGKERVRQLVNQPDSLPAKRLALLETVVSALEQDSAEVPVKPRQSALELLADLGRGTQHFFGKFFGLLGFVGLILQTQASSLLHPSRWRVTALVAQIQATGLNAVPIVALLTFLVGCVLAFLGATVLEQFGASIYTVALVALAFLREFGVLLTAILLAGRTASAFTAQIGSMKANEEIDAIRTLGLDPIELLVLPRVMALLISLPLLTFIAMLSGILGGGVVCLLVLDISPTLFISILHNIPARHFWVGIGKAPIYAFLIAAIGCMEGFRVSGSAASVGEHTTSSVVQSIFVVILLDAVFAMFFMEMHW